VFQLALQWFVAAFLGGLVGAAELVARYRDAPGVALRTRPAVLYIVINIVASVAALALVRTFGWQFSVPQATGPLAVAWTQVLISGIGAMALFRTSLFVVRAGDKDIGIGPSSFLQVFLAAADREVDRERANARAAKVGEVMKDIDFDKAVNALPPFCLALMQNLPDDAQVELGKSIELLKNSTSIDPQVKVRLLGLELVNAVGADVLEKAVTTLGDEIKTTPAPPALPLARSAAAAKP
jgi:hypothetical protein